MAGPVGVGTDSTYVLKGDLADLLTSVIEEAIEKLPEYIDEIALKEHEADTTSVHGIADTADIATKEELTGFVGVIEFAEAVEELEKLIEESGGGGVTKEELEAAVLALEAADAGLEESLSTKASKTELSTHTSATTSVHGISNTANLAVKSELNAKENLADKIQDLNTISSENDYPSALAVYEWALDRASMESAGMGVKVHGGTAGATRPTGFCQVTWIGSVEPTKAAEDDIWIEV